MKTVVQPKSTPQERKRKGYWYLVDLSRKLRYLVLRNWWSRAFRLGRYDCYQGSWKGGFWEFSDTRSVKLHAAHLRLVVETRGLV